MSVNPVGVGVWWSISLWTCTCARVRQWGFAAMYVCVVYERKSLLCRLELLNISHLWSNGGLNVPGLVLLRSLSACLMQTVELCTFIKPSPLLLSEIVLITCIPQTYSIPFQGFCFTLFVVFRLGEDAEHSFRPGRRRSWWNSLREQWNILALNINIVKQRMRIPSPGGKSWESHKSNPWGYRSQHFWGFGHQWMREFKNQGLENK